MKIPVSKAFRFLINKDYRFLIRANHGLYNNMEDREYLLRMYKAKIGKPLNLDNPKSFNEKMQWLKLYDRNPVYSKMADKQAVKEIVSQAIGEQYVIPTLGVWEQAEAIEFDKLPAQFVLKCTHDSHDIVICKDAKSLNRDEAIRKLSHGLKRDYYLRYREWPYKDIKPRIIAEPYLEDPSLGELRDYKFYCFDGKAKQFMIAQGRFAGRTRMDYFDLDYNHLDLTWSAPNAEIIPEIPKNCDLMIRLAEELSKGIPMVRVDFYNINGTVYFGEFTFFHGSGMHIITPASWDLKMGEWIHLPEKRI